MIRYKYKRGPVRPIATQSIRLFRYFYEPKLVARFKAKIDERGPDECWPWIGSCDSSGYGKVKLDSHTLVKAPRVAWLLGNDEEPGDSLVLHSCDNRKCVNPKHLFLGDQKANMADKVQKGRARNRHTGPITVGDLGRKNGTEG